MLKFNFFMMKKLIPSIYIGLSLLFFSCGEDFLDLKPNEDLPIEDAIQSLNDLESAVIGMYDGLQSSNHYGRYFILVPDVMSDDVKQNASANRAKEYAEYGAFADHFLTRDVWTRIYNTILRANIVINSELEVGQTFQAEKDNFLGEAYAIRALCHFDLVRLYGQHYGFTPGNDHPGVPIVLEFDEAAEPSRSTVAQVYERVLADLSTAASLISDDFNSGRVNLITVKALQARVNLYMGNWATVEGLASEVINSSAVVLTDNDAYVDTWLSGTSPDVIFEIVNNAADNFGSDALGRMYIQDGYGDYLPSADVVDLIPDGDVRGELYADDAANLGGIYGTIRVNKWPSSVGQDNVPVIRLSEMYLIRAEARYNQGKEADAQADVTAIRQRGLPSAEAVTATGTALMDEIELEKRIELAYEGHRLWDLMRWKRGVTRTDCTAPAAVCSVSYPNDRFILPIPQPERDANPNIEQNVGY